MQHCQVIWLFKQKRLTRSIIIERGIVFKNLINIRIFLGTICYKALVGLFFYTVCLAVQADITTDGSVGTITTLQGPNFTIPAELGKQMGGNLFHSFERFSTQKDENVTFTGPGSVQNIIGRITGGEVSSIGGLIRSDIPNANLFLFNTRGFLFGPEARLELTGSLYFSTASRIDLDNQTSFDTRYATPLTLSPQLLSAPPVAFGFLDDKPGRIEISQSALQAATGKTLSISGGEIQTDKAKLIATSGRVELVAILKADRITGIANGLVTTSPTQLGQISLRNNTEIDVGKEVSGNVFIRGGKLAMDNSSIFANSQGGISGQSGGIIAIDVDELSLSSRTKIDSRALGVSHGGQIIIRVTGTTKLSHSDIFTTSRSTGADSGDAGSVILTTGWLNLTNSTISTATYGAGNGGDILVSVNNDIDMENKIVNTEDSLVPIPVPVTAIQASSGTSSENKGAIGNAGRIHIRSNNLNLSGNTKIDNSTFGAGQGGSITLEIGNTLRLAESAIISADSKGTGSAGTITVNTDTLDIRKGMISTTADRADGGNLIVNARYRLNMDNSQISTTVTGGLGNGGNLAIGNARFLTLHDSKILANASGGNGGIIFIVSGLPLQSYSSLIEASSDTGIDGEVKIEPLNLGINIIPIDFFDASRLIKERCESRIDESFSRFTKVGRGGLPNSPDDLQPYLP